MHSNPYDFTKPISNPSLLAGREKELEKIEYYLDQATTDSPKYYSFAFVGKRAVGKSSLLNITRRLAGEKNLLAIKVSLNKQMVSNHLLFYEEIADGILAEGKAIGMYQGVWSRIRGKGKQTRGSADIEMTLPGFKFSLSGAKESKREEVSQQYLIHALNESLEEARKHDVKGIVVLLDECDLLAEDEVLLQKIRNVMQDTSGFIFVFAGTNEMFSAIDEVLSPASRSFIRIEINDFKEIEQTRDCILRPLDEEEKKKVDPQCIPEIHYFTGGSPYEITLVSHYMYKKFTETNSNNIQITVDVLDEVLGEIERLRRDRHHEVASKIKSLWPSHLKVLLALLEFGKSDDDSLANYMLLEDLETLTPKKAKDKIRFNKTIIQELLDASIISLDDESRTIFQGNQFDILYLKYYSLTHGFDRFFVGNIEGPILNLQHRLRNIITSGIPQIEHVVRFDETHGVEGSSIGKELILTGRKFVPQGRVSISIDPERLYHESDTTFHYRVNVPYLGSGWVSTYIFESKEEMNITVSRLGSLAKKLKLAGLEVILDDEVTLNKIGLKKINTGEYSDAAKCFEQSIDANSKSERAFWGKALALFFLEKFDESIDNCDRALELVPNLVAALELKGKCFFHKGEYDTALILFDRALNINPEYWDALDNKGRALLNLGKFDEAISCFEQVMEHQASRVSTMKLYARTLWGLQAHEKALSVLELILKFQPEDKEANIIKGNILSELERYSEVINHLSKFSELYSDDSDPLVLIGAAHINLGELEKGLAVSERATLRDSENSGAWYNKACALARLGKVDLAILALRKSVELSRRLIEQAKKDSDFDTIRESEEFKRIIEG